jgi:hypothetical protein
MSKNLKAQKWIAMIDKVMLVNVGFLVGYFLCLALNQ